MLRISVNDVHEDVLVIFTGDPMPKDKLKILKDPDEVDGKVRGAS